MSYVFDPCGTGRPGPVGDATIVLVGCGGTGAFLAEALCRLLIGRRGSLHLVDPDLIEPRNALRQAYLCGIWLRGKRPLGQVTRLVGAVEQKAR
ncbi:MAG TPA: ThiF family adenylyltransferase [Chloroflexota bacterium]|nr:ThiF family adenylyltransferase [Chloroflexota bacterium]